MELQTFDFEASLKSIGNFVQAVISTNDENKKTKLMKQLNQFNQCLEALATAKKRFKNFDLNVPDKKIKLDSGSLEIPNEIWTKIMNYLPTKEIFQNFGLVSKKFHSLIDGIQYFEVKNIDEKGKCDKIIEIVNNSKALIELNLDIFYGAPRTNSWKAKLYSKQLTCARLSAPFQP